MTVTTTVFWLLPLLIITF